MPQEPFDQPSQVEPIDGEVSLRGPGAAGLSLTPRAARETSARLSDAADRAEQGHAAIIDVEDEAQMALWCERLGVDGHALRNTVMVVGPDSEAVALRLESARGATD